MNRSSLFFILVFGILFLTARTASTAEHSEQSGRLILAQKDDSAEVDKEMTHPDPEVRINYLDKITSQGATRKLERAIKIAMRGTDSDVRAAAFRAYMLTAGTISFEILLSEEEKRQVRAFRDDRGGKRPPNYIQAIATQGSKITLKFEGEGNKNSGKVFPDQGRSRGDQFSIRGERLLFSGITKFGFQRVECEWEIRPTKQLKLIATAACRRWPNLKLETEMY